jgi:hypothetical protein
LVALSNFANDEGCCYPSIETLEKMTSMNRKTIISALDALETEGWIEFTGECKGPTARVKVYRLRFERTGEDPKSHEAEPAPETQTAPSNSAENGTVKQYQNRNGSKNGMVPFLRGNSTVFGGKQSQKRYSEPLKNRKEPAAARVRENPPPEPPTKAAAAALKVAGEIPDSLPLLAMTEPQLAALKPTQLVLQFEREHPEQKYRDRLHGIERRVQFPAVVKAKSIIEDLLPEIRRDRDRAASLQPIRVDPTAERLKQFRQRRRLEEMSTAEVPCAN